MNKKVISIQISINDITIFADQITKNYNTVLIWRNNLLISLCMINTLKLRFIMDIDQGNNEVVRCYRRV